MNLLTDKWICSDPIADEEMRELILLVLKSAGMGMLPSFHMGIGGNQYMLNFEGQGKVGLRSIIRGYPEAGYTPIPLKDLLRAAGKIINKRNEHIN